MDKMFKGYNRVGNPIYENSEGVRLCNLKGCTNKAVRLLCHKHSRDGINYSEYLESIKKPFNVYTLVNDEYYEVAVNNSDIIYKIDKDDYAFAQKHNWFSHGSPTGDGRYRYLVCKQDGKTKKYHIIIMEEEIERLESELQYKTRVIVDHINGDVYDNRRSNLRVRTQSENNMNKVVQRNNTSGIVGISWHKRDNVWQAYISVEDKSIRLGEFYYLRNAVKARIEAERKYFGEHSLSNRDYEYSEYVEKILSMPEVKEPVIKTRPNNETGMIGVKKINDNKFVSSIIHPETKKRIEKTFYNINDAKEWKILKEEEFFGHRILYRDELEVKKI